VLRDPTLPRYGTDLILTKMNSAKEVMMRILVLFTLMLSLTLLTCARTSSSDPVITLERTACFGTCPVYSLKIYEDGRVVYEGKEFVKKKGVAEKRIEKKALEELVAEFMKLNYLELKKKPDCTTSWTDFPSAITSLNWKGRSNVVEHYHGCEGPALLKELSKLEDKIDETVNTDQWIK
jgi:hypothetical protein